MTDRHRPYHIVRGPVLAATSFEIRVHLVVFVVLILPVAAVILPSLLFALSAYMVLHLFPGMGAIVEANWLTMWLASAGALLSLGAITGNRALARPQARAVRRLRPPSGKPGEKLTVLVAELWATSGGKPLHVPSVFWFSNFNVMANAAMVGGKSELHVSSALWERAVCEDPVSRGILAHELAHLIFRDPPRFALLEAAAAAIQGVARLVKSMILVVVLLLAGHALVEDLIAGRPTSTIAGHLAAAIIIGVVAYWAAVALDLAGRRYAAFIIALMELRADIAAGQLVGKFEAFGAALANDPGVRAASIEELRHSLLSPSLTHFSTGERAALLSERSRLATPKLRYFALSLLLALLLPLNPVTPLLFGGALDHLLTTAVNVALQATSVAMLIVGAEKHEAGISLSRASGLAAALVVAGMVPHINLYVLGYLLFSLAVQLAALGKLSGAPMSLESLGDDLATTAYDLSGKVWASAAGFGVVIAIACTAVGLWCLSRVARGTVSHSIETAVLPICVATVLTILSSYDEWRGRLYTFGLAQAANFWRGWTSDVPWLRLSAPVLGALLVFILQELFRGQLNQRAADA